ncbi:hypothetical protein J2794_003568 [Paraburkholderia terricola]|uniref:hypothetical protein n=1 Tax=Paraburkholderia terricola TaxID=169427 RepID=UPI00285CA427|nr:hypothetical protein [Paraburkholderia terricola]MDR6447452.1 hypothetical protein [Paraburkholderia terricola]
MTENKSGSTVTIDVNGAGFGKVVVDGAEISRCVQSVSTAVTANEAPIVKLSLAIPGTVQIRHEGADLLVDGVVMPASVELALWRHLSSKYGREVDATTVQSTAREWCLRDD